ncbi:hypothetical protein B0H14DRAFT_2634018 [Mycena olivaceomarginata]|nr:hypothetical protein B0H14DRAFT_2634018 [Mycena olivaceomarginata]
MSFKLPQWYILHETGKETWQHMLELENLLVTNEYRRDPSLWREMVCELPGCSQEDGPSKKSSGSSEYHGEEGLRSLVPGGLLRVLRINIMDKLKIGLFVILPSVHFTAVLTAVWRRYGMLGRPVAQGRDGTAVRLSVRPTVLDGYGDNPYWKLITMRTSYEVTSSHYDEHGGRRDDGGVLYREGRQQRPDGIPLPDRPAVGKGILPQQYFCRMQRQRQRHYSGTALCGTIAAPKHKQTLYSGSRQHSAAAKLALSSGSRVIFSGSLLHAAAVWRHLEGVTARQCDIAAAVWRQLKLTSAAMLRHCDESYRPSSLRRMCKLFNRASSSQAAKGTHVCQNLSEPIESVQVRQNMVQVRRNMVQVRRKPQFGKPSD